MGFKFKVLPGNRLEVLPSKLKAARRKFQTRPWPGFPTDLMSPFIVLATQTLGTILCHDWMYEWRMFFVDDLISMGANILIADPHRVIGSGPTALSADILYSKDIRAGMSLILAALAAKGESVIDNIEMVERGYEKLEKRLNSIGAIAILGERNIKPKTTYIKVKDSREALGKFSAAFYGNPSQKLKVIGITGTDGKTTTANLIYWILKTSGAKVGLVSTIGAKIGKKEIDTGLHVTNPDPVSLEKLLSEMLRANCSYGILEVTSHGLDQKRVAGVKFDAGVLTNITHEHIDYHKSLAKYIKVKAKLFQGVKYAILNKKDFSYPKIKSMIGAFKKTHDFQSGDELNAHMSSSGRRGNRGLKSAEDIIKSGVKIVDYPQKLSTKISEAIEKRFDEDYNRENAQAAIAVAKEYGVKDRVIVKAIKTFPNLPGRMEEIKNTEGIRVFVDFAHTPNALESALLALRKKTKGRIITVLGCAGE